MEKKVPLFEAQPLTIYNSTTLSPGMNNITFDFGANPENDQVDQLYDLRESELIEKALSPPVPLALFLQQLGVNYPYCWLALEVDTKRLIKDWNHDKPGDVDLVAGNIKEDCISLDYIVGIQVKLRKVKAPNELRSFPSGTGTEQAHYTALMGFDKTMLLHFIIREPQPVPKGFAPSWNSIVNSNFINAAKACKGAINDRLEKERELFGYGWIGWGQAYGEKWQVCGGFSDEIILDPPLRPRKDNSDVRKAKESLNQSLNNLLSRKVINSAPYIWRPQNGRLR